MYLKAIYNMYLKAIKYFLKSPFRGIQLIRTFLRNGILSNDNIELRDHVKNLKSHETF